MWKYQKKDTGNEVEVKTKAQECCCDLNWTEIPFNDTQQAVTLGFEIQPQDLKYPLKAQEDSILYTWIISKEMKLSVM